MWCPALLLAACVQVTNCLAPLPPLQWTVRKPYYTPSPPASQLGRDRSWAHSLQADDEREDGGGAGHLGGGLLGGSGLSAPSALGRSYRSAVSARLLRPGQVRHIPTPHTLPPSAPAPTPVSPEGMSDYADEGIAEGPSPQNTAASHRAFSSHHLQQLEMAAALEGGRSSDNLGDEMEMAATPSQAAAAAAAARVHGLRDDAPGQ